MNASTLRDRWARFYGSRRGRLVVRALRLAVTAAVVVYLANTLIHVGWRDVWASMPVNPLFYLFGLMVYISIPLSEVFIYRLAWGQSFWFGLPALIKKRIYNQDVLGYSGEVFFASWAQASIDRPLSDILRTVRDNNILSSIASTLMALALIVLFLGVGHVRLSDFFDRDALMVAIVVSGGALLLVPLALRFRRYLFAMPARLAGAVFGILSARLLLGQVLRIAQWSVVMPEVPIQVWFSLSAASLILSRIPIVPSQDLIFLGIGVEMSSILGVPEAGMFSMLAVSSAIDKVLNLGLFLYFTATGRTSKPPANG